MPSIGTTGTTTKSDEDTFDSGRLISDFRQMFNSVLDERKRAGHALDDEAFLEFNREISKDLRQIWGKAVYEESRKLLTAARIVRIFNEEKGSVKYIVEMPGEKHLRVYPNNQAKDAPQITSEEGIVVMPPPTYWQIVFEPIKKFGFKVWQDAKSTMWKSMAYVVMLILFLLTTISIYNMRKTDPVIEEHNLMVTIMERDPYGRRILYDVRKALGKDYPLPVSDKAGRKGDSKQQSSNKQ